MFKLIYFKLAPFIAPFFLLTTLVFFSMCVWRGEVIMGLQAELNKDKDREIKVVVDTASIAKAVSDSYELYRTDKQKERITDERIIEKIITVPIYDGMCFDTNGVQYLNNKANPVSNPSKSGSGVSTTKGAD